MKKYIIKETIKSVQEPFGTFETETIRKQVANYYQGEGALILGSRIQAWNRNKKSAHRFNTYAQALKWLNKHYYCEVGEWTGWQKIAYSIKQNRKVDIIEVEK